MEIYINGVEGTIKDLWETLSNLKKNEKLVLDTIDTDGNLYFTISGGRR